MYRILSIAMMAILCIHGITAEETSLMFTSKNTADGRSIERQYFLSESQAQTLNDEIYTIIQTIKPQKPSETFNPMAGHHPIYETLKLKKRMTIDEVMQAARNSYRHEYSLLCVMVLEDDSIGLQMHTSGMKFYRVEGKTELAKMIRNIVSGDYIPPPSPAAQHENTNF